MAINTPHPLFQHYKDFFWTKCRDLYEGEETIKHKGVEYLPATPGQNLDGMEVDSPGYKSYEAYKARANVPDFFKEAVETFTGMMHEKPATIELPDKMKYLLDKASPAGESMLALLRRINEMQLVSGRLGLLCDLGDSPSKEPMFYIAVYDALAPINWDASTDYENTDKLNLVVLDESNYERDTDYNWVMRNKYRVLSFNAEGKYVFKVHHLQEPARDVESEFLVRGAPIDFIPFTFVNSKDVLAKPDVPPLMGLVRLCLSIYRSDADYRHTLFMQGQDTLVVIGGTSSGDDSTRIGAGAKIDCDVNGDAKFIGVSSQGLPEQRMAIENDKARAGTMAGKLANPTKTNTESGEALKTRIAAQTATLNNIAKTGALALETALKQIAKALGEDESKVAVKPNLEFAALNLMGDDLVKIMVAKQSGAPISLESVHALCQERGLTTLDFKAELKLIEDEPVLVKPQPAAQTTVATKGAGVDSQIK